MPPPLLVDADATLGRNPRADVGDGGVTALLERMDRVGVAAALVGHSWSRLHDPATGNALVSRLVAGRPRLAACWTLLPPGTGETGGPEEFARSAREHRVRAVRAYPADHGYELAGPDAAPMFAALAEAGLPLLLDAPQAGWPEVEALARRHPSLPVVVGRAGYRVLRRVAGVLERTGNVYVGTADLSSHRGLEWLAERFGPGRLVFGTGMPERDPAESVTRLLWSELPDEAVAAIGTGTLATLTDLDGLT
ncbi:amidohydrolase family protein [Nonomuraea pusilla]|uniref:Predicted metal-dependent hydrolase, TIM-barrel fold n=1 Tax=Nonomuraea pusilla TaxID=46177 RepID=A0A1H7YL94_9ACTN|nr:amidohydrolase family protein [Nonomuraea pusilla]SEM47032.1 Predicted metal-dependent hydrolase, TIM-barrel fold [Nonomuraea pusilla]